MKPIFAFDVCLTVLSLIGQGVMHILFISRLTGKKRRVWHFPLYIFLLGIIQFVPFPDAASGLLAIGAQALALYGMSHAALGNGGSVSWTVTFLAIYISQLSFGIINSMETILFPQLIGKKLLYPVVFLATLAAFTICFCLYAVVLKFLSLTEDGRTASAGVLLPPGMFFCAAQLYILQTAYRVLQLPLSPEAVGKHAMLLLLQILGLGALLCMLYACRHLDRSMEQQEALRSLEQAAQAQKGYIAEAQARYEQTRAFRHDIQNHLSVVCALLDSGKTDEGRRYLQKLRAASSMLAFPYQTGNPIVDILLGEKLGLAKEKGILAEVSLLLPASCGIEDPDWCVIFSNALDNAISACRKMEGERVIRISGERQGDFFMLAFENPCLEGPLPPAGTGLSNLKAAAEKYQGTMLTEKTGGYFCLHVLLNLS